MTFMHVLTNFMRLAAGIYLNIQRLVGLCGLVDKWLIYKTTYKVNVVTRNIGNSLV